MAPNNSFVVQTEENLRARVVELIRHSRSTPRQRLQLTLELHDYIAEYRKSQITHEFRFYLS